MTRVGKIARLPSHIRNSLNERLQDGEEGDSLLEWLNGLPTVGELIENKFNGRRINKQNLSAWRLGGFKEWQRLQESHAFMRRFVERSDDLAEKSEGIELTDRLAQVAAGEMTRVIEQLMEQNDDPKERWKLLQEFIRELVPLRAGDQRAVRLKLHKDHTEIENDRYWEARRERDIEKARKQSVAPLWASLQLSNLAGLFGGGDRGWEAAALILEAENDLKSGTLCRRAPQTPLRPVKAGQGGSSTLEEPGDDSTHDRNTI